MFMKIMNILWTYVNYTYQYICYVTLIGSYQVLPLQVTVELGAMAMKEYSLIELQGPIDGSNTSVWHLNSFKKNDM